MKMNSKDKGFVGDMEASEKWGEELGIGDWFRLELFIEIGCENSTLHSI